MASDFSRTLALLRKEKKISQRTAAGDLAVSQALLSHYENGLREPGLSFVIRAADYYGVSCDYLLGRSMDRNGTVVSEDRMHTTDPVSEKENIVLSSLSLLLQLTEEMQSEQLTRELENYCSIFIYRTYRYLYMSDPACVEALFRTHREHFDALCDARQKQHELRLRSAARGQGSFGLSQTSVSRIPLSPSELAHRFPTRAPSLLAILQRVSDSIDSLAQCSDLQKA